MDGSDARKWLESLAGDAQRAALDRNAYQWRAGALITAIERFCAGRSDDESRQLLQDAYRIANINTFTGAPRGALKVSGATAAVDSLRVAARLASACGLDGE